MKKKIRAELIQLATQIITAEDTTEIASLYSFSKELYEKLTVLKYINDSLGQEKVVVSKSTIASKFEKMATEVLRQNASVPENNPHAEDIITPGINTIKEMVLEMPEPPKVDEVLSDLIGTTSYIKNEKDILQPKENSVVKESKSVNDRASSKEIKVDLNNRLAFVKHLFNDSTEDYNRVLSQLNTIDSQERSVSFLVNMVKPDYNNWEGKEEIEARFMEIIERKFT